MKPGNKNSYKSLKKITINNSAYKYFSLLEAEKNGLSGISKLPKSLKVLLEIPKQKGTRTITHENQY